jgi:hypothetical protein
MCIRRYVRVASAANHVSHLLRVLLSGDPSDSLRRIDLLRDGPWVGDELDCTRFRTTVLDFSGIKNEIPL